MRPQSRRLFLVVALPVALVGFVVVTAYSLANSMYVEGATFALVVGMLSRWTLLVWHTYKRLQPFTLSSREYAAYLKRRG